MPPESASAAAPDADADAGAAGRAPSRSREPSADSIRAFCSSVRPPLHRSTSAIPLRASAAGIDVIATFCTSPFRT